MQIPYSWLKDYLNANDLDKGNWTAAKIGERLTVTFNEFEGVDTLEFKFPKIVVGQIKKIAKHPYADRLSLVSVNIGSKTLSIVCGASNLYAGMFVPVALPGAKLGPEDEFEIKVSEIRGVPSEGMICSAEELGLEDKSLGILDLGKGLKPGTELDEAISFDDEIMNLTITSNRADAINALGIAKETAVACDIKFNPPKFTLRENSRHKIDDLISVQILESELCHRYTARVIEDVKITESPLWLKRRLIMSGLRPINNVVDITNYVLLEYGQPLHAFDYDLIIDHKIIVRRAKPGERIITLDEQKVVLTTDDLVIADNKRPLAIAGIIGGHESAVNSHTKTIVLESAAFARDTINRSAKNLGIMTDASIMFGKGIPMSKTEIALDRAAYLIQQIAGGNIVRGQVDVRSRRIYKKDLSFDYENLYDLLGIEIPKNTVKNILTKLDFVITSFSDSGLTVQIPDYRIDIEYPEDIYEEVGRIFGYDQIPDQTFAMPVTTARPELFRRYKNKLIRFLYNQGWSEVYSYNFTSQADTANFGFDPELSYELVNPVDQQQNLLRQTLLPGLINKLKSWSNSGDSTRIFEWGRVMSKKTKPTERDFLSLCYFQKSIPSKQSFLEVKAVIMGMLSQGGLKLTDFQLQRAIDVDFDVDYLHPYNSLIITSNQKLIGTLGVVHPNLTNIYQISPATIVAEFNLNNLIPKFNEMFKFIEPSKYPASLFDASFIVDKTTLAQTLIDSAYKVGGKNLSKIDIFDEYVGPNLEPDQRSISLRFHFQSFDRTLSGEEIETKMQKIFATLQKEHSAILRDK